MKASQDMSTKGANQALDLLKKVETHRADIIANYRSAKVGSGGESSKTVRLFNNLALCLFVAGILLLAIFVGANLVESSEGNVGGQNTLSSVEMKNSL